MFGMPKSAKCIFLEQIKVAREDRANEKSREYAAIIIQARIRGRITRQQFRKKILSNFDDFIRMPISKESEIKLHYSSDIFKVVSLFLLIFDVNEDEHVVRLDQLCRYLVLSLDSDAPVYSYIGVAFNKKLSRQWITQLKKLLYVCCLLLAKLKPEVHKDNVLITVLLHTLISFTSSNSWKILKSNNFVSLQPGMMQLCNNIMGFLVQKGFFLFLKTLLLKGTSKIQVTLKSVSLAAIVTLAIRPLVSSNYSDNLLTMFIVHVLTTPALIYHLHIMTNEPILSISTIIILEKILAFLIDEESFRIVSNTVKGTQTLTLLANLVHMFYIEFNNVSFATIQHFTKVITSLLLNIPNLLCGEDLAVTQWHEILGWFTPESDYQRAENLSAIKKQMHLLWSHRICKLLLGDLLMQSSSEYGKENFTYHVQKPKISLIKRLFDDNASKLCSTKHVKYWRSLESEPIANIMVSCVMYHSALTVLSQLKLDILSGLCYSDGLLYDLFLLIRSIGPQCGLTAFLNIVTNSLDTLQTQNYKPPMVMLILFCDLMTHFVTILDDIEMYEQHNSFELNDYVELSQFLNNFIYKVIVEHNIDLKILTSSSLFISLHTLLLCLYRRDCRRQFAPLNHWIIADIKPSQFVNELEKGKLKPQILLQKMPHIIPHGDRVKLFKRYVLNEKNELGLNAATCTATITIHRDRIIEDGYRQLGILTPKTLKGVIRVRFVNQQGLHEAGIDQDGVFKEFLEETIQLVFNPSLNLFKTTIDQCLYPAPTSHVNENHLQLFEFIGRMLGKAVYEGIVVDVSFASFFLSQLLGHKQQALYSCIDELPSLDRELYKNLTFVKHYKGDISELNLTFSVDENQMGKVITHDLYPGGRTKQVTNDNKINYIHYMAYFRMHTQIREQAAAFIRGFRCIVSPDWLLLFSAPELQRLISGDNACLDLNDLRKNTQYYGGFHDAHRVISWLWDVLINDFTIEEQKLFLKFVTSCSKPPLLGFAHLEPPFSVRCVEVSDDEDLGDTIGSVIRGFFTIRKKDPLNRLPTSSTCFNLLKLPNYKKKSNLRDKLRYAISSNTGFELS